MVWSDEALARAGLTVEDAVKLTSFTPSAASEIAPLAAQYELESGSTASDHGQNGRRGAHRRENGDRNR